MKVINTAQTWRSILFFLIGIHYCAVATGTPSSSRIQFPVQHPTSPTTCVYSGVFPLAGENGSWKLNSLAHGEYTTELQSPSHISGILNGRVPESASTQILSVQMRATERLKGRILDGRNETVVELQIGSDSLTYSGVVKTQQVCDHPAGVVKSNTPIQCKATTRDAWTLTGSLTRSGSLEDTSTYTIQFLKRDRVTVPWNTTIDADVIETIWDDGLTEWRWYNPEQPWCPIRVERRRLDRVIGTDLLMSIETAAPVKIIPRRGNLDLINMAYRLLIFGIITIGAAFALAWVAGKRRKQPPAN
ncbi:MAG: hypothetical protein VX223_12640 [Myxococcota bacterium]|nr:hypothetical protein [Myxococcota bacterium]